MLLIQIQTFPGSQRWFSLSIHPVSLSLGMGTLLENKAFLWGCSRTENGAKKARQKLCTETSIDRINFWAAPKACPIKGLYTLTAFWKHNNKRKKLRFWLQPNLTRRKQQGQFRGLIHNLKLHYDCFCTYFRMSVELSKLFLRNYTVDVNSCINNIWAWKILTPLVCKGLNS